ncbi:MAG: rhomboid family intramembrane serine protease [Flavobacteriia bacterium]|nr:rhomboid family intramembrane serine protease [Flavobacteriia bacterium]
MNRQETFVDLLRHHIKFGGATVRLILANLIVYLFLSFLEVIVRLFGGLTLLNLMGEINNFFVLKTDLSYLYYFPITIVTNTFTHFSFFHLLSNMLMLYVAGKMFEQIFNSKKLVYTYLLCGISGSILEILAQIIFPQINSTFIVGASGAVLGIFAALAFYRPNLEVNFFGIFPVKIIILALIFLFVDLFSLGKTDGTAHFAHIGGALIGILSIKKIHHKNNILTMFQRFIESIGAFFKKLFGQNQPKMKVQKGGRSTSFVSDEEYNMNKKQKQEQTDIILDKISKSGYESLTKAEKDFLFKQSKNG